jgi:hypothetical protein
MADINTPSEEDETEHTRACLCGCSGVDTTMDDYLATRADVLALKESIDTMVTRVEDFIRVLQPIITDISADPVRYLTRALFGKKDKT